VHGCVCGRRSCGDCVSRTSDGIKHEPPPTASSCPLVYLVFGTSLSCAQTPRPPTPCACKPVHKNEGAGWLWYPSSAPKHFGVTRTKTPLPFLSLSPRGVVRACSRSNLSPQSLLSVRLALPPTLPRLLSLLIFPNPTSCARLLYALLPLPTPTPPV